jgi:hypothetical protein
VYAQGGQGLLTGTPLTPLAPLTPPVSTTPVAHLSTGRQSVPKSPTGTTHTSVAGYVTAPVGAVLNLLNPLSYLPLALSSPAESKLVSTALVPTPQVVSTPSTVNPSQRPTSQPLLRAPGGSEKQRIRRLTSLFQLMLENGGAAFDRIEQVCCSVELILSTSHAKPVC